MTRRTFYESARADLIRIWRVIGKRNLIGTAFLVLVEVEREAPGTLAAIVTRIVPGMSVETAAMLVSAGALYITRWIDKRKAAPK